jgi:hypothetical protein
MPVESDQDRAQQPGVQPQSDEKEAWQKPEIISFQPVVSAQGISYNPADGISNLTV